MKKVFIVLFSFFILLLISASVQRSVLAEDSDDDSLTPTVSKMRFDRLKENREDRIEKRHERREEFKDKVEARREAIKDKMEDRREALKEKLEEFRDKKKAKVTERISDNLNKINEKRVEAMTRHLDRIEEILGKVEDRTAEAREDGKDVSEIEVKIAEAKSVIEGARGAVSTQAGKDYTLVVSDEGTVAQEAKEMRDKLHEDLKAVHELIVVARKAVSDTIRTAYSSLGKENVDNE